jgi:hypothetical protein
MEKELGNSEKKKRIKQPSRPKSAQPGRAPACPRRLTGGPRQSATVIPRARPPSLARCPVGSISRRQFPSPARSLSLSLCLAGLDRQSPSHCPARPFLLPLRRGPALSVLPPSRSLWTGACALIHVVGFLGHDARPRAQLPS